ncbi:MAG: hypothetical protein FWG05_03390 [Kiritimatiellaeota bacterium]|nr:hypothetical protein [Kiritimatiellota bacterium]
MSLEFDSEIKRLEGKIKWNVVYFPFPAQEHFGSNGNKQPDCTKREQTNLIELAKKEETKTNRINALVKRLKVGK